ncbi:hypothetical protein [Pinisolibacter sp.]|uniref:hypothetical protein n=1 Tax=Pinisolibacter sp. TaxID=2172024 RepID=UPI002FDD7B12
MTALDAPEMIHIRVAVDAITGDWIDVTCPARSTIAEIVAAIPLDPAHEPRRELLEAWLGDHHVPRDRWHVVRPATWSRLHPVTLVLRLPVAGGGRGGQKALSIVAALALITLTAWVGGGGMAGLLGSAFKAGTMGARLLAAGLSIGGALALQGLLRPDNKRESKDPLGFASAGNDFEPGASLQRVIGRTMVAPQLVVPPFTMLKPGVRKTGGTTRYDQTVTAVYALAGLHDIDEVRLGSVEASTIADLEVEIRTDDTPLTLVTDTRIEEAVNIELSDWEVDPDDPDGAVQIIGTVAQSEPDWHRVEGRDGADALRLEYVLPAGLIYRAASGATYAAAVALRHRMRLRGSTGWGDWINLPQLMIRALEGNDAIRLQLEIRWVDVYPASAGNPWPVGGAIGTNRDVNKIKGWALQWVTAGVWESPLSSYFVNNSAPAYTQWEWESDSRIILYLLESQYPKGRWQVETKRSWVLNWANFQLANYHYVRSSVDVADLFTPPIAAIASANAKLVMNPSYFSDAISLISVQSVYDEYPIASGSDPVTLIAIRGKNRSLETLRVLAQGLCRTWTGTGWALGRSRNPADWYRHVLCGPDTAVPTATALIDETNLADWAEWCDAEGLTCDMVVKGKSAEDTLRAIALTGRASPNFGAPRHSVVIDRPRSTPVGLISQRNAGRFETHKAFGDLPHALRVTIIDEVEDYKPREILVYAPGYASTAGGGLLEATVFEAISYEGIQTEAQARARAALDYGWRIHRSALHSCTMDIEHLEFERGSLVLWETDILGRLGGRGRIRSLTLDDSNRIITITLDDAADYGEANSDLTTIVDLTAIADLTEPRGAPGCVIRCDDGTLVTAEVEGAADGSTVLTLAAPLPMPMSGTRELIGEGTLVVTGALVRVGREVLIWEIAPAEDLTARITAVDYAATELYGA